MASRREPYETRTVGGHRRAARLIRDGWEVVTTTSQWLAPTKITLRRPNPRYRA